jgi:hypothetical protein
LFYRSDHELSFQIILFDVGLDGAGISEEVFEGDFSGEGELFYEMDGDSLECLIRCIVKKRGESFDGRHGFDRIKSALSREGWVFIMFGGQFCEGREAANILTQESSKECAARERGSTSARDFFQW